MTDSGSAVTLQASDDDKGIGTLQPRTQPNNREAEAKPPRTARSLCLCESRPYKMLVTTIFGGTTEILTEIIGLGL